MNILETLKTTNYGKNIASIVEYVISHSWDDIADTAIDDMNEFLENKFSKGELINVYEHIDLIDRCVEALQKTRHINIVDIECMKTLIRQHTD